MGRTLYARDDAPGDERMPVIAFVEVPLLDSEIDAIRAPGGVAYVREVVASEMGDGILAIQAPGGRVFVRKP